MNGSKAIQVGAMAPELALVDQNGAVVTLAEQRQHGHVVLYFMRSLL